MSVELWDEVQKALAVASLFFTRNETSDFSKKTIFQFNLSTGLTSAEIGPGDSFSTSPLIYNDATEDMYVFIKVEMPIQQWKEINSK